MTKHNFSFTLFAIGTFLLYLVMFSFLPIRQVKILPSPSLSFSLSVSHTHTHVRLLVHTCMLFCGSKEFKKPYYPIIPTDTCEKTISLPSHPGYFQYWLSVQFVSTMHMLTAAQQLFTVLRQRFKMPSASTYCKYTNVPFYF